MPDRFPFYVTEQLSEHMYETPEGFLVCVDVPIARIGEYVYKNNEVPVEGGKDGLVKILRDEDQVFAEATIKSFEGKPVTINHPDDFVTPENWKDLAHGMVQNVRRGDKDQNDLLIADLILNTEDAIKLVKGGLRQVSCGYDAQYDQIEPGLGKQKDIIGNHLALVVKGRAGNRCAIMDTACSCCGNCMCKNNNPKKEDKLKMKNSVKDALKKIFPKLNLDHVKDEDLEIGEGTSAGSDVEVAQQAAAEAKEAAVQAVEAAKQAAAAAQGVTGQQTAVEPEPEVDQEEAVAPEETAPEETQGEAVTLESVNEKIEALTSLVQELISAISGEDEEEAAPEVNSEEAAENDAAETEEVQEEEKETEDEGENENIAEEISKEKGGFVKDSAWHDLISKADVIAPGIVAPKPKVADIKKASLAVKRRALSESLTKDHAMIIKPLLRGKKITQLTEDALDTAFVAAFEMVRNANNSKVQKKSMQMKDLSSHTELAEINKRNKEFWNKK